MLAVVGGKGGCGKTTTVLGLAAALARRGRRPLAVDADADVPDLGVRADVPLVPGVDEVAAGTRPARALHPVDAHPGVTVLPATPGADVPAVLDDLARLTRPVLLDCPAGASAAVGAPLRAADRGVVVTTPDREAVEDAVKTAALARALGTPVAGAVLVRAPDGGDGEREDAGLAAALDAPVLGAVPETEEDAVLRATDVRATYDRVAAELTAGGPGADGTLNRNGRQPHVDGK